MRHQFKLSAVELDKPLDADLVDMPPYDDVWASRRYIHETISGEPQTSLNARPRNVPRNAELMHSRDVALWRRRRELRHHRGDYEGSFPWDRMSRRGKQRYNGTLGFPAAQTAMDGIKQMLARSKNMDMLIQLLLLLNVALILYIILRLS